MPFTPFDTKQSSHMDVTMHPVSGVVEITIQFHPNNKGGYHCRVYELPPPWTGTPKKVREWKQGEPGTLGAFGHGASLILPNGALLVAVPLGIDNSDNVTPTISIEPGFAKPYTLGTTAHSPIPLGPALTDFLSPTSATEDLYDKSYLPTDLDTPNKLALRITKQLFALNEQGAAIRELVEILRKQGVLV